MAKLGSIPLLDDEGEFDSGASFTLTSPSQATCSYKWNRSEISVVQGQKDVVIRFAGADSPAKAFEQGHHLVQEGMDMLSILGRADLSIQDADAEHCLWWHEPAGTVLRLVSTATMKFTVGPVELIVKDKDGNLVPPTPVYPQHNLGFRYFRLAQNTDDLFDSFRNMYLAFEALLSAKIPRAQRGHGWEGERAWLDRALSEASKTVNFIGIIPTTSATIPELFIQKIYLQARCPLFHAKDGADYFPPAESINDRRVVAEALHYLTHFVLRMAAAWHQASRMTGGVSLNYMQEAWMTNAVGTKMHFSNDTSPADPAESDLSHPRYQNGVWAGPTSVVGPGFGHFPGILGMAQCNELDSFKLLSRVTVIKEEKPVVFLTLDSPIAMDGLERIECLCQVRMTNTREPKSLFLR